MAAETVSGVSIAAATLSENRAAEAFADSRARWAYRAVVSNMA